MSTTALITINKPTIPVPTFTCLHAFILAADWLFDVEQQSVN
jgi:hypothetical protein